MPFEIITKEKESRFEILPPEKKDRFEIISGGLLPEKPTEPTGINKFLDMWKEGAVGVKSSPENVAKEMLGRGLQPPFQLEEAKTWEEWLGNVAKGGVNLATLPAQLPFQLAYSLLGKPLQKGIEKFEVKESILEQQKHIAKTVFPEVGKGALETVTGFGEFFLSPFGHQGYKEWTEKGFEGTPKIWEAIKRQWKTDPVFSALAVTGIRSMLKKASTTGKHPTEVATEVKTKIQEGKSLEKALEEVKTEVGKREKPPEELAKEVEVAKGVKEAEAELAPPEGVVLDKIEPIKPEAIPEIAELGEIIKRGEKAVEELQPKPKPAPKAEPVVKPMPTEGILGSEAGFIRIKREPNPRGVKAMELVKRRVIDIDKATLDSEAFITPLEVKLTKLEREAIPFIRQGIKDPQVLKKIGREDLIPLVQKPSLKVTQATQKIGQYFDEAYDFLRKHGEDVGFVEDYVTQMWDIPKGRRSEVINHFATYNPFTKKRTIPTLEEGIKLGLKPKEFDITKILKIYDQYKIKTIFNKRFAEALKELKDENGQKLIQRYDKAPPDWKIIEHPALSRAMAIGKIGEEGILLKKAPVKVHPDISREVKIILSKRFSHEVIDAWETINAFSKKGQLSLSFFHPQALFEAAFSTGIGLKSLKLFDPIKVYRALRYKDYEIYKRQPLAKDSIEHLTKYGALPDYQINKVRRALEAMERRTKNIPIVKHGTKKIRQANDLWDRGLWDYVHNTLKLYGYEENVFRALKTGNKFTQKKFNRGLTQKEINAIKDEMGLLTNDTFGGQRWEIQKVLGNPKMQQMLHWLFLAPDWTFSVLKQAVAPVKGISKQVTARFEPTVEGYVTKKIVGKALTKRGILFWARAVFYFNLIAQSANYYNTKKYLGEGKPTWENDPGHELNIFVGYDSKDGYDDGVSPKRYLRMGKQFREVMEWGIEPEKKFGAKLSPALREGIRQAARHDPGSGFPTEFEDMEFWESLPERTKSIVQMPVPFSLRPYIQDRPKMFMFTFPTSKGMTNYKTIKLFKKELSNMKDRADNLRKRGLKDKEIEKTLTKNRRGLQRIYISALENNLDAESLFSTAQSAVKADITLDNKKIAQEIYREIQHLKGRAIIDALKLYKDRGILTPEIEHELNKLDKKQGIVEKQKKLLPKLYREYEK